MPDPQKFVTLYSLADGAAAELFQAALTRVLENIQDPNTDHKAKRAIDLKFEFDCNEDRQVGAVGIKCSTKLGGVKGVTAIVFYGRQSGELVALEQPRQQSMFPEPAGKPVAVIGGKKE